MKTYLSILYGKYLLALTLLLSISPVKAQSPFRARYQQDRVQPISAVVTSVDTIELSGYGTIYALSVDATVEQPREGSFVRVVLEDSEGHDHLVLESDRFRNDSAIVHFSQHCQETSMLSGITPVRLKCYATGDAVLNLTAVNASTQRPLRNIATPEARRAVRREQAQEVVNRINAYNEAHHKLWRAGITNRVLYAYDNDEDKGLTNSYIANFKYYTDGIYEMGERPTSRSGNTYQSPYVSSFDWRNRHGKNWITSVKNQGATEYCTAFATVGMLEACTNLHFNDSSINLDLSEQCLLSFLYGQAQTSIREQLLYIASDSIIDEDSCPYGNSYNSSEPRPTGLEAVTIRMFSNPDLNNNYDTFSDTLKYHLIHYGPGAWGFSYPAGHEEIVYGQTNYSHNMTLVGYGTITATDTITLVGQSVYTPFLLTSDSLNLVGETYWIFKDSYGGYSDSTYQHNGYRYILFHDESLINSEAYFLSGTISRRGHSDSEIIVEDADGDGYFCWGIGESTPTNLPAWATQDEDSDDSNDSIGPSDNYGHPAHLIYGMDSGDYESIFENTIDTTTTFIRGCIEIASNVTYTIKGTKVFHPNALLCMNTNSTLIVDDGAIVDPSFDTNFGPGCTIILRNGGEIIYTKHKPDFTLPLRLSLRIEKGSIRYDRDFR